LGPQRLCAAWRRLGGRDRLGLHNRAEPWWPRASPECDIGRPRPRGRCSTRGALGHGLPATPALVEGDANPPTAQGDHDRALCAEANTLLEALVVDTRAPQPSTVCASAFAVPTNAATPNGFGPIPNVESNRRFSQVCLPPGATAGTRLRFRAAAPGPRAKPGDCRRIAPEPCV
jgi:hypothetical protein